MNKRRMTPEQLKEHQKQKTAELIERNKSKQRSKLEERIASTEKFYDALYKKQADKIRAKYDRKARIKINKIKKEYKHKEIDEKKKSKGQEVKIRISTKIKQKAYAEVCKYAKLYRTDSKGYLTLADTGEKVHRSKAVGGHIRSKKNYPQLAFDLANIRPITRITNKLQAESLGDRYTNVLTPEHFNNMKQIAEDKSLKSRLRDSKYYQRYYEDFKELNKQEEIRLGKYY